MMEMFAFGILGGAVLTLIMIGVVKVGVDEGESVSDSDDGDNDSVDDRHNRGSDRCGPEQIRTNRDFNGVSSQEEEKEKLANDLRSMKTILGLCRTERERLEQAANYIEGE